MTFGEKLKKLRKDNDITQEQLADKIFVTRTAISKWETGKGFPAIDSLKAISALFGISIDELISDADVENKRLLDKKFSNRLYVASVICLTLATIFSLAAYFFHNRYLMIGGGLSALGYVIFGYFVRPKDRRFAAKKLLIAYIISRVAVLLFVIGVMILTFIEIE